MMNFNGWKLDSRKERRLRRVLSKLCHCGSYLYCHIWLVLGTNLCLGNDLGGHKQCLGDDERSIVAHSDGCCRLQFRPSGSNVATEDRNGDYSSQKPNQHNHVDCIRIDDSQNYANANCDSNGCARSFHQQNLVGFNPTSREDSRSGGECEAFWCELPADLSKDRRDTTYSVVRRYVCRNDDETILRRRRERTCSRNSSLVHLGFRLPNRIDRTREFHDHCER